MPCVRMPVRSGLCACLALGAAMPAFASDAVATLEIEGEISARCAISLGETNVSVPLTAAGGTRSIPFSVDCNQPLSVQMTSRNGGLSHVTHGRGETYAGFANFVPYSAAFSLAVNGAAPVVAESEAMRAGAGGSTGVTPYQATGMLGLTWRPTPALLGGQYSDVIEIRVSGG